MWNYLKFVMRPCPRQNSKEIRKIIQMNIWFGVIALIIQINETSSVFFFF